MNTVPISIVTDIHTGHFFDKDTMGFFKSTLPKLAVEHDGDYYFVTGERVTSDNKVRYTIRKLARFNPGAIKTVGEYRQYSYRMGIPELKSVIEGL